MATSELGCLERRRSRADRRRSQSQPGAATVGPPEDSSVTEAAAGPDNPDSRPSHGVEVESLLQALARINRVSKPRDPLGTFAILAWSAQSYLIQILDSVFYLGFKGKTGAGKGTSLECACLLADRGTVLSTTTEAYLSTVLDEGRAIGIPEADRLLERNDIVGKILRDGYRRGAVAGLKVQRGEGGVWETAERSLFGPKAFDFHVSIDPHLLGRTIVIEMEPDNSVDRALDAEKKARHLAPVRDWLIRECARALREWSKDRVDALWEDPVFRDKVDKLGGKTGRDHVLGATLLLICQILGWFEYVAELPALISSRKAVEDWSEEAEVLEAIRSMAGETPSPELTLTTEEIHERINADRARLYLRPLSRKSLGRVLTDLGFRKGVDWLRETKGPARGRWLIRPLTILTQLTQVTQPPPNGLKPSMEKLGAVRLESDAPLAPELGQTGDQPPPPTSVPCVQGRRLVVIGQATFLHADDRSPCYHPTRRDASSGVALGPSGTNSRSIDTGSSRPSAGAA
jgi:hypothetical protein